MELGQVIQSLGIALGLGLLVGLQRERTESRVAGFRTFPLITVAGTLCALLAREFGGWIVGLGLVSLALIILVGHLPEIKGTKKDSGVTTEAAMLVMYAVGAYLVIGFTEAAVALGGVVALLLHLKPELHAMAGRIGDHDFRAIMQFVLISLVILPVLPNQDYGPYAVLNPFRIWLMVVFIVGISLAGYISFKFFGEKGGALAGGLLGGVISSTATAVSYARRSREQPEACRLAAFVILMSSAIVFVRVLLVIGVVAPRFLPVSATPFGLMFVLLFLMGVRHWRTLGVHTQPLVAPENPTELKPALFFAGLYAVVLLAVAMAREHLGQEGLYAVSALSGLTNTDAITLSISDLVGEKKLSGSIGWRLILVGILANMVFKLCAVAVAGHRKLLGQILVQFGLTVALGGIILIFWS